jgi:glycerol kinase
MRVDGGMAANGWLLQRLADITGLAVERPTYGETTVLGAAFLAGLGVGVYPSRDAVTAAWHADFQAKPRISTQARAQALAGWHDAVARTRSRSAGHD